MQWFRMYAEFAYDPKVQSLSETLQRRYIMLLCVTCNGDIKKMTNDELAFMLRIDESDLETTIQELQKRRLIDENKIPTGWSKRQYISDSSTNRVKVFREKKRFSNGVKQKCNVTVTPPDTDTDTDTDTDKNKKDDDFENWWKEYPHKIGKGAAKKSFSNAIKIATYSELVEGVKRYIANKPPDINYCNPATWLNQERWKDEPARRNQNEITSRNTGKQSFTSEKQRLADKYAAEAEREEQAATSGIARPNLRITESIRQDG